VAHRRDGRVHVGGDVMGRCQPWHTGVTGDGREPGAAVWSGGLERRSGAAVWSAWERVTLAGWSRPPPAPPSRSPAVNLAVPAAIVAGVLIAIQTSIIGAFGERVHPFVASTWVHVGGLVVGVVGVAVAPRLGFELAAVRQAPWGLLAGVAGLLLVSAIAVAVGGIGLASTLAIVTGMQLLVAFGLEATGLLGRVVALDPVRVGGAVLIVAGVYLVAGRGPAVA
jgi:bacterial/archaeal transporter family-2 protein